MICSVSSCDHHENDHDATPKHRNLRQSGIADAAFGESNSNSPFWLNGRRWESQKAFVQGGGRCKTETPPPDVVEERREEIRAFRASMEHDHEMRRRLQTATNVIEVNWVVLALANATKGNVSDTMITNQISVLNNAFAPQFQFVLKKVTRVWNDAYYDCSTANEMSFKNIYHQGGMTTLNLYSCSGGGYLGWAYFPSGSFNKIDGVIIAWNSVPGGDFRGYNLGDVSPLGVVNRQDPEVVLYVDSHAFFQFAVIQCQTATHEVGHWLGLEHTFEGGCDGNGDFISDTPAEKEPAFQCVARDSCPDKPGSDPIYNFMDYTPDACMFNFTDDQRRYMVDNWYALRLQAPKPPTAAPVKPPTRSPVKPPTAAPVKPPTRSPVKPPTSSPVKQPTASPVKPPTASPVKLPTTSPVKPPTASPVKLPTTSPVKPPTASPVKPPTESPVEQPTDPPVEQATEPPTNKPTKKPTMSPTKTPTMRPTMSPVTKKPTKRPTMAPRNPTKRPTMRPTMRPKRPRRV
jgi:Pregnancy-associated plasma protein-A